MTSASAVQLAFAVEQVIEWSSEAKPCRWCAKKGKDSHYCLECGRTGVQHFARAVVRPALIVSGGEIRPAEKRGTIDEFNQSRNEPR